jgi:hypothetical protein
MPDCENGSTHIITFSAMNNRDGHYHDAAEAHVCENCLYDLMQSALSPGREAHD